MTDSTFTNTAEMANNAYNECNSDAFCLNVCLSIFLSKCDFSGDNNDHGCQRPASGLRGTFARVQLLRHHRVPRVGRGSSNCSGFG